MVRDRFVVALVLGAALLMPSRSSAELISFFGDERIGASAGQFLRIPVGARTVALGSSSAAMARGATAMFSNPGALSTQRSEHGFFVSHFEYAADIDIDHIGYVRRDASWQWGLGFGILRSGDIERTTETSPNGTGQFFNANQFIASVSIARLLTDRFTVGGNLKFLQENLDDFENRAVMVDLGALYYLGYRTARIGFALTNFGPDLRLGGQSPEDSGFVGEWQNFPAPTMVTFGTAYDFTGISSHVLTLGMDFLHPTDESESIAFSGELGLNRTIELRGGYRYGGEENQPSAGVGLNWSRAGVPIRVDYGVVDRGNFGVLHMISLEFDR